MAERLVFAAPLVPVAPAARGIGGIRESELLDRARRSDQRAFAVLVRRHQGKIRGLLLRLTASRTLADDLAQEVFLRAYRALPGFEGRSSFSTWTYRIAYNVFLNYRTRSRAHLSLPEGMEGDASVSASDESPGHSDLKSDLSQAIASLPPRYRAVVVLYYLRDVTYREIAEILELPIGTVKTHLHRARALLRTRMHGWVKPEGCS